MRLIIADELTPGMTLGDGIYGTAGQMLLAPGTRLTDRYVSLLRGMSMPAAYVADPDTLDVEVPKPLRPQTRAAAVRELHDAFGRLAPDSAALRELSLNLTQEHAGSDRFANAVRSVFGSDGFAGVARAVDGVVSDLLHQSVLVGLNTIKTHDLYTYQHSIDVTIMGVVLARKAGWDAARVRLFGIGCMLHDVGKVLIPPAILNKPGRLSDAEFEEMKAHPLLGYHMVKAAAANLGGLVPQVAYQHHERQDGSGYPRGLRGTNALGGGTAAGGAGTIHDFGSVAAVADVYDAMSSTRPYRKGWAPDRVVATIAALGGTHLNRAAVDLFLSAVAPFPVCSEVVVCDGPHAGCRGIVARVDPAHLRRPVVRVLHAIDGSRVSPFEIDLREELDVSITSAQAGVPEADSMGSRRQAPRPQDPLPPEVIAALRRGTALAS